MAKAAVILHHETHPAGGLFEIVAEGDVVRAVYQMPFDLSTGEWDFLRDQYALGAFADALREFVLHGSAVVSGSEGSMRFFSAPKGDHVQFTNTNGPHSKSQVFPADPSLAVWLELLEPISD